MDVTALVEESEVLVQDLDPIVEEIADVWLQSIPDSAWYRLGCTNFLARDARVRTDRISHTFDGALKLKYELDHIE